MKIGLDIMSGDNAPLSNINGAIRYIKNPLSNNNEIILYGNQNILKNNKSSLIEFKLCSFNIVLRCFSILLYEIRL